jgi:hypothetical protein
MKSKVLIVVATFLIVSLVCVGMVSCSQELNSGIGNTGEQNGLNESTQTLSEDEYSIEIAAIALELITIVNGLDEMLMSPEIEDPDWITTINLVIEDIVTLCDEAYQIAPPDSMTDIHIVNLEIIDYLDSAIGMLAEGVDKKDMNLVSQATTEMWLAAETLAEVIDLSE